MILLKGKKISDKILEDLKIRIRKEKLKPGLAVVLVGKNPASEIYVRLKKKAAGKVGIIFHLYRFPEKSKEAAIIGKIRKLSSDKKISGIIVQLPLPGALNRQRIISAIDRKKDADGFHPKNPSLFSRGSKEIFPVLPKTIVKILEFSKVNLKNKKALIIANSIEFGGTMKKALRSKKIRATYILARDLKKYPSKVKNSDIIVTLVGRPGLITGNMLKEGVMVVDGGITKVGKKVLGDVDLKSVQNKASYVTPVPGGVGPVTIACLLENVYLLSKKQL